MKKELIFIIVGIITVIAIIASYLIFNVNITYDSGEMKLINLTQTPEYPMEGDNITITAEITGGSPSSGIYPLVEYESFFGFVTASPYSHMEYIKGDEYKITFRGNNGTEIWYIIYYGTNILAERTIQIGDVEPDELSTLSIKDITIEPEIPTTSTTSVVVSANISSNFNITDAERTYHIISQSRRSSSSGGFGPTQDGDIYTFSISLTHGSLFDTTSDENETYSAGTIVYYLISAQDESGSTALATGSFTIS